MRCKGENCRKCRKNKLNKAKCWSKWGLCGACAVKKYPSEYRRKVVESFKVVHKKDNKPGINGYQGMDVQKRKFANQTQSGVLKQEKRRWKKYKEVLEVELV